MLVTFRPCSSTMRRTAGLSGGGAPLGAAVGGAAAGVAAETGGGGAVGFGDGAA